LEQVIMNLAVNARDAIQGNGTHSRGNGRGRISLFTRSLKAKQVMQLGSEVLPAADYTVLIVQDTGGGFPPHVLPKLFEPFFTTKEQGKGTGLGLSTAYGIVKQSGGFIFADNIVDKTGHPTGARFTVYFPVHRGEVPKKREAPSLVSSDWSAGGKVLLVEDEEMVRIVAERALARAGYDVTSCANGEEGLAAIAEGGVFDVVVSDVVMPGMDGYAVCARLQEDESTRDIPVIFVTAHNDEAAEERGLDVGAVDFISKPINPKIVRARVKTHLTLKAQSDLLRSLAYIDGLTGINNRRHFDIHFATEWGRAQRGKTPLSVILLDVDFFKRFNDRYGHQAGDDCLRRVASALNSALNRPADMVARYGGEEFVCLLPDTDLAGAMHVAERLGQQVFAKQIEHADSTAAACVTVSLGVCAKRPDSGGDASDLLAGADEHLYLAKEQGRNKTCGAELAT
jgi:diguanylate cyclase (GGDEF)-like protein